MMTAYYGGGAASMSSKKGAEEVAAAGEALAAARDQLVEAFVVLRGKKKDEASELLDAVMVLLDRCVALESRIDPSAG
jgi:VIT1/CCC1 family predicted Fe2+/Mn2+ transporter